MTSTTRRLFQRSRFFGIGGALMLAIWLASAIASPAQTFRTLLSFDGTDGANPAASLVQGRDGNFYGTTANGGVTAGCTGGCGTIFRITPGGTLTTIHNACSQAGCADGRGVSRLIQATDRDFYGTTVSTGYVERPNSGTVFRITPAGRLSTLYSFCSQANCADGASPSAGVVQATDGNFYGTTFLGGINSPACNGVGCGTVFRITPAGKLSTLYSFCSQANCADGENPNWLIQATDGNFYGTTPYGGSTGQGTIFEITRTGKLIMSRGFHGAEGVRPNAGLIQASNGNFYGTAPYGGDNGTGTLFEITPAGKLTTLYSFCSQANCADGAYPSAGIVQATDGNFYGTTRGGGANGTGTLFEITPAGTLTTLYSFCSQAKCADGVSSGAPLIQATTGMFYGTTGGGPIYGGDGSIFSLSTGLGPFVTFVQASGKVGWTAEILGQGFTGATAVSFNGTPAAGFTVKSDTYLRATVPAEATTGPVTVTTPSGTLTSNVPYRVRPQIVSLSPSSGPVGTQVTITGVSLTQTTKVEFCGVPATFTVDSDTQVTTTVPAGAHDGIAITTAGGKTWSAEKFIVTQ